MAHRFQKKFTGYKVSAAYPLANLIRTARKNFTPSVWEEWVTRMQQRKQHQLLEGHPEGLWASAWQIYQRFSKSAASERAYLFTRRRHDEFWYAKRFQRDWPVIGAGARTSSSLPPLAPKPLFAIAEGSSEPPTPSPKPPELDSVSPTSLMQGQTHGITLKGKRFDGSASVDSTLDDITVTTNSCGDDTMSATFAVSDNASPGDQSVTVSNQNGQSNSQTFTVTSAPPVINSVDPDNGEQNQPFTNASQYGPVTLSGLHLESATVQAPAGITIVDQVATTTDITVELTINADASTGSVQFTVTNSAGSDTGDFQINLATPDVQSIDPDNACQGSQNVSFTITGSGFDNATLQTPSGVSASISNQDFNTISGTLSIDQNATTGATQITVANSNGQSDTANFTVNQTYTITATAAATQPSNQNRTTFGVGEVVNLAFSGSSPTWTCSGSGQFTPNGNQATYTAAAQAETVTITATASNQCVSKITLNVIAPSEVMMTYLSLIHTANTPDIGMCTDVYLYPDTVNFGACYLREQNENFVGSGYYACQSVFCHCGNCQSVQYCQAFKCDPNQVTSGLGTRVLENDKVYSGYCSGSPVGGGTTQCTIPVQYSLDNSTFYPIATDEVQTCTVSADGTTLNANKCGAFAPTTQVSDGTSPSQCG